MSDILVSEEPYEVIFDVCW